MAVEIFEVKSQLNDARFLVELGVGSLAILQNLPHVSILDLGSFTKGLKYLSLALKMQNIRILPLRPFRTICETAVHDPIKRLDLRRRIEDVLTLLDLLFISPFVQWLTS